MAHLINDVDLRQDENDDQDSTEFIPRRLPTPMTKMHHRHWRQKEEEEHYHTNNNTTTTTTSTTTKNDKPQTDPSLPSVETTICSPHKKTTTPMIVGRSSYSNQRQNNDPTRQEATEEEEQETTTTTNMSSVRTALFNSPATTISATNSKSLIDRVSMLLSQLTNLGFIPKQTEFCNDDYDEESILSFHNDKACHEYFLCLISTMIKKICHPNQNDIAEIKKYNEKLEALKLHGLLTVFEMVIETLSRSNQTIDYLKQQGNEQLPFHASLSYNMSTRHSSQDHLLLQQENEMLRRQLMEIDSSQLMGLQNSLTSKHLECQRLQGMVQSLEYERNRLDNICQGKDSVNARFERDVMSLQAEYETVANENNQLHMEMMTLRQCVNEYESRMKLLDEDAHASTMAKNDVLAKWNDTLKERTRLETEIGKASRENATLRQQLEYSHAERNRMNEELETLGHNAQKSITDLASSTRDTKKLSIEIEVLRQSMNHLHEENQRLSHEMNNTIRMNNDLNSQKPVEYQQRADKTENDSGTLRCIVSDLQMEVHSTRSLLEEERKKVQHLEHLIASFETRESASSEQIQKLVREKALLGTKLNEANARYQLSIPKKKPALTLVCTNKNIQKIEEHNKDDHTHHTLQSAKEFLNVNRNMNKNALPSVGNAQRSDRLTATDTEDLSSPQGRKTSVSSDVTSKSKSNGEVINRPKSLLDYLSQEDASTIA